MQISTKALAVAAALIWGGALLVIGLVNLAVPYYGIDFLEVMSSVYPGYYASGGFGDTLVGAGYAVVDGGVAGFIFGWLYNLLARRFTGPA